MCLFCVKEKPADNDVHIVHWCRRCHHCECYEKTGDPDCKIPLENRINLGEHTNPLFAVQHAKEYFDGKVRMCEDCEYAWNQENAKS